MSESVLVEISTDKPELDCKLCYLPAQTEDSKIQVRGSEDSEPIPYITAIVVGQMTSPIMYVQINYRTTVQ